jgi:hypothetical protein
MDDIKVYRKGREGFAPARAEWIDREAGVTLCGRWYERVRKGVSPQLR